MLKSILKRCQDQTQIDSAKLHLRPWHAPTTALQSTTQKSRPYRATICSENGSLLLLFILLSALAIGTDRGLSSSVSVFLSSCVTHIRQAPSNVTILIGEQPLALCSMHLQPLPLLYSE
jgi:hypothetical protein